MGISGNRFIIHIYIYIIYIYVYYIYICIYIYYIYIYICIYILYIYIYMYIVKNINRIPFCIQSLTPVDSGPTDRLPRGHPLNIPHQRCQHRCTLAFCRSFQDTFKEKSEKQIGQDMNQTSQDMSRYVKIVYAAPNGLMVDACVT